MNIITIITTWLREFYHNHICNDFEKVVPHAHPECFNCDAGSCEGCSVNKYPDSLGDLDEEDQNINWASGQDDVPKMKEGNFVFENGDWRKL